MAGLVLRSRFEQVLAAGDGPFQDLPVGNRLVERCETQYGARCPPEDVQDLVRGDPLFRDEQCDPARLLEQIRLVQEAAYPEQGVRDRAEARGPVARESGKRAWDRSRLRIALSVATAMRRKLRLFRSLDDEARLLLSNPLERFSGR